MIPIPIQERFELIGCKFPNMRYVSIPTVSKPGVRRRVFFQSRVFRRTHPTALVDDWPMVLQAWHFAWPQLCCNILFWESSLRPLCLDFRSASSSRISTSCWELSNLPPYSVLSVFDVCKLRITAIQIRLSVVKVALECCVVMGAPRRYPCLPLLSHSPPLSWQLQYKRVNNATRRFFSLDAQNANDFKSNSLVTWNRSDLNHCDLQFYPNSHRLEVIWLRFPWALCGIKVLPFQIAVIAILSSHLLLILNCPSTVSVNSSLKFQPVAQNLHAWRWPKCSGALAKRMHGAQLDRMERCRERLICTLDSRNRGHCSEQEKAHEHKISGPGAVGKNLGLSQGQAEVFPLFTFTQQKPALSLRQPGTTQEGSNGCGESYVLKMYVPCSLPNRNHLVEGSENIIPHVMSLLNMLLMVFGQAPRRCIIVPHLELRHLRLNCISWLSYIPTNTGIFTSIWTRVVSKMLSRGPVVLWLLLFLCCGVIIWATFGGF